MKNAIRTALNKINYFTSTVNKHLNIIYDTVYHLQHHPWSLYAATFNWKTVSGCKNHAKV